MTPAPRLGQASERTGALRDAHPPATDHTQQPLGCQQWRMAFFGLTSQGPQNPFRAATEGENRGGARRNG